MTYPLSDCCEEPMKLDDYTGEYTCTYCGSECYCDIDEEVFCD
jgi:hypothetical protein